METNPMSEDAGLEDRVERLESGQGRIERMLEQLVSNSGPAHDKAQAHEERHLDRPSTVAEMVAAELKKARDDEAKAAKEQGELSEREQIKAQLAKLSEQPPAQPQPRRQKIMWGAR